MERHQIKAFIDAMAASDLAELEVTKDGWTLRLVRAGRPSHDRPTPARPARPRLKRPDSDPGPPTGHEVRAPLPGIVHLQASPNEPAFVALGQAVSTGATLCIIEAMKTFNQIRAERAGIVEAVLVTSGDEVAAGQPLIRIA